MLCHCRNDCGSVVHCNGLWFCQRAVHAALHMQHSHSCPPLPHGLLTFSCVGSQTSPFVCCLSREALSSLGATREEAHDHTAMCSMLQGMDVILYFAALGHTARIKLFHAVRGHPSGPSSCPYDLLVCSKVGLGGRVT